MEKNFRLLRRRGIAAWLVVHERTRGELTATFGADDHIRYIPDTRWHVLAWRWGRHLPDRVANFTLGMTMRLLTQVAQKAVLAIEDSSFYDHGALDWSSLVRAMIENANRGEVVQGGAALVPPMSVNHVYANTVGEYTVTFTESGPFFTKVASIVRPPAT